ncbi:hypothetical protein C7M61_004632 [Candidozyma pseudohaemuli]|uniref:Uncharacterized protein n=1 Tax=Candidozyma pseudohaemuli TaxID=418784 RepID=A0A2P7YHE5_9ASCO|nr:hypothetical protein C7M61_004632 [[Candida] pseudohaemulonii]PSK35386.1 hypothetical protein C7M61_004632 [[Candida] pseudohaemulonii]
MVPKVSVLNPPKDKAPEAVALRLNLEVLALLRGLHKNGTVPKLVVKNGQFVCIRWNRFSSMTNPQLIKVGDLLVYPCSSSNELLRFDIYNARGSSSYDFAGTVTERLNVLTDPRQIKNHQKAPVQPKLLLPVKPSFEHARKLSLHEHGLYAVDARGDAPTKFLALVALGPTTRREVETRINANGRIAPAEMDRLFLTHTQSYNLSMPSSSFTESDTYPSVALGLTDTDQHHDYVILKDKAYKDLRPWLCPFTPYERALVIENAHHALSRLGYLDTHPLRRRITEKPLEKAEDKKPVALGGGLLSAKPGSPSPKRSASPRVEEKRKRPRNDESPLKHSAESSKKFVASLLLSSSSEDERHSKKAKKEGKRSNSSGSNQSTFSNATSYTLPSLINEEHNDDNDHSEDDMKLLSLPRASPALPSKPAPTSNDKRQQYYKQLALNFYSKYLEYKNLHDSLLKDQSGTTQEKKRRVMKLFEMHNLLAGWKRKLWDYYNESNMAQGIMHLSRHKKTNSGSGVVLAPLTGQLQSQDRFQRSGTASPQVSYPDRFAGKQNGKRPVEQRSPRPKVALDY